jgi:HTH-type transcriptional regulator/antitoxin HigA
VLTVGNTLPHSFLPDSTPHWSAGLSPRDLVPMIGQLTGVNEVLKRKRPLTLRMIWNLHEHSRIPLESLIKPPEPSRAA